MKQSIGKIIMLGLSILCLHAYSQKIITGTVLSENSSEGIPGVSIYVLNDLSIGTISNNLGEFKLQIPEQTQELVISAIGFKIHTINLNSFLGNTIDVGIIHLRPKSIDLIEINIISSIVSDLNTPVSVSNIGAEIIEKQIGDQAFPEILRKIPGIYATRTGGGSGDAEVSLRGFKQENVALLLNGIPISGVEDGLVFWNNWIGLAEATQLIQVQKGIGASKVALNSVGGTINIITKSTETQKGGSFSHSLSSYGNKKSTLRLSTGQLENGWAMTFLGSRTSGPGYVDATYVDAWAYFLSASRQFGNDHKLTITILGAPQKHGQRNTLLTKDEVNEYGIKYNKDWGSYNGKLNNISENFYHKPQASVNHYWNISPKTFLASSAYISFGYGGGKWAESFKYGPSIFSFRNPSTQIDWTSIYNFNKTNQENYELSNGKVVNGFSKIIQTDFLASHIWSGILTTLEHQINDHTKLILGFHGRYFKSKLQEKVRDLLGGDFWIDDYAWAIDGVASRNQIKKIGDITKVDNGAIINFGSLFGQFEYSQGKISSFFSSTISHTWYQREDRYNYVSEIKSVTIKKIGFDIKAGASINFSEQSKLYLNAAYYSKVPYFKFIFSNWTNTPSLNIRNEGISAIELGYEYKDYKQHFSINAYQTYWSDISFLSREYVQLSDNNQTRALVKGLDALHQGVEIEFKRIISNRLSIGAMLSLGNWKWKNDVVAELFNDNNVVVDTTEVYANGLFVGDAPQTQLGLFILYTPFDKFDIRLNWTFNDRLFADFDPASRNNPNDRKQSYQLPSYHLLDVHLGYTFLLAGQHVFTSVSCFNLFDQKYVMRGEDGANHKLTSFQGNWGFGRTFNLNFKLIF